MIIRYVIQSSFANEIAARLEYIYECTNLWMLPQSRNQGFIEYGSLPLETLNVFFIIGHNLAIKNYFKTHSIFEKNIVAITCNGTADFYHFYLKRKRFFLAKQNLLGYAPLYIGSEYDFHFNLTESEILFYNSKKNTSLIQRLNYSFTLIRET